MADIYNKWKYGANTYDWKWIYKKSRKRIKIFNRRQKNKKTCIFKRKTIRDKMAAMAKAKKEGSVEGKKETARKNVSQTC